MKKLSKFSLWKVICCLSLVIGLGIGEAGACDKESNTYLKTYSKVAKRAEKVKSSNQQSPLISELDALEKRLDNYVFLVCEGQSFYEATNPSTIAKYLAKHNDDEHGENSFNALQKKYIQILDTLDPEGKASPSERCDCNTETGEKCWRIVYVSSATSSTGGGSTDVNSSYACSVTDPCNRVGSGCRAEPVDKTDSRDVENIHAGVGDIYSASMHTDGSADYTHANAAQNTANAIRYADPTQLVGGEHLHQDPDGILTYEDSLDLSYARSNEACHIDQLKDRYMGTCYSCVVVSALISTFMAVADKVEPLMQMAGTKLLFIGMMIWLPIYILGKLSSFVSLEPMKMVQELLTFFFKCLLAYTLITSGLRMISTLIVNPLLIAGADYGIAIVDGVMPDKLNIDGVSEDNKSYRLAASNSIDRKVFDKIMTISKKADAAVSLNFVIGNALFCHSYHAGAISFKIPITENTSIPFYFPDFWLMLCGAVIWFFAFMVVMGVNFYLLDLSFKIGFALMALPITIGLWPFNKFKGKFAECLKIIINAAGTFMFLGISTGISIVLISSALGGTDKLLQEINANNQEYVSQLFSLTGSSFLIILFAFLYSHNLISETVSKLTDKFFGSMMSGITPMNELTTQTIDFAKKQIGNAASIVTGGVGSMASTAVKSAATQVARKAVNAVRGKGKKESK